MRGRQTWMGGGGALDETFLYELCLHEMAAPGSEISRSVLFVDGSLQALHRLGFPLPSLASMQAAGALLRPRCFLEHQEILGRTTSVTFFWPSSPSSRGSVVALSKTSCMSSM